MSVADQVRDIVDAVSPEEREELRSNLIALAKSLMQTAQSESFDVPEPSGDALEDATALGSAVVVSLSQKIERRKKAQAAWSATKKVAFRIAKGMAVAAVGAI